MTTEIHETQVRFLSSGYWSVSKRYWKVIRYDFFSGMIIFSLDGIFYLLRHTGKNVHSRKATLQKILCVRIEVTFGASFFKISGVQEGVAEGCQQSPKTRNQCEQPPPFLIHPLFLAHTLQISGTPILYICFFYIFFLFCLFLFKCVNVFV